MFNVQEMIIWPQLYSLVLVMARLYESNLMTSSIIVNAIILLLSSSICVETWYLTKIFIITRIGCRIPPDEPNLMIFTAFERRKSSLSNNTWNDNFDAIHEKLHANWWRRHIKMCCQLFLPVCLVLWSCIFIVKGNTSLNKCYTQLVLLQLSLLLQLQVDAACLTIFIALIRYFQFYNHSHPYVVSICMQFFMKIVISSVVW